MNKFFFAILTIMLLVACTSLPTNGDMFDGLPPRFLTYIDWNELAGLNSSDAKILLDALDLIKQKQYLSAHEVLEGHYFNDPDFELEALLTRNYILNNFSIITSLYQPGLIDIEAGKDFDDYDKKDFTRIWITMDFEMKNLVEKYPEHPSANFFAGYFISQEVLKYGNKHLTNKAYYTNFAPNAIIYLKKAIELDAPYDAESVLGGCYLFNGNYDLAEEYYLQSYNNFENYNALSSMCLAQTFSDKAEEALENLDYIDPFIKDPVTRELAYGTRIAANARLNRFNEAKRLSADFVNKYPESILLKTQEKILAYLTGAEDELLAFIAEHTDHIPLPLILNEQLSLMGRPDDYEYFVKTYSDRLLKMYKGNETSLQWYYFWANVAFIEKEDFKSLKWSFEQMAIALNSDLKSVILWPVDYMFLTKQFTFRMFED